MLMSGPVRDGVFEAYMPLPNQAGRREEIALYAMVEDVAGLHDRMAIESVDPALPLGSQVHGGSSFSVRDPAGHVLTFRDYGPCA